MGEAQRPGGQRFLLLHVGGGPARAVQVRSKFERFRRSSSVSYTSKKRTAGEEGEQERRRKGRSEKGYNREIYFRSLAASLPFPAGAEPLDGRASTLSDTPMQICAFRRAPPVRDGREVTDAGCPLS